jgi:hypothetical protein
MTPVFQTIVEQGKGDCQRAAVASLFDLQLDQVPHFKLYGGNWWKVYCHFLLGIGWEFHGTSMGDRHASEERRNYTSVNGHFLATVPSKTFPDVKHSVVIDEAGVVVHDPNPNQLWKGINVIETGELDHVDIILPENVEEKEEQDMAAVLKALLERGK